MNHSKVVNWFALMLDVNGNAMHQMVCIEYTEYPFGFPETGTCRLTDI